MTPQTLAPTFQAAELFQDHFDGPVRQERTVGGKRYLRTRQACRLTGANVNLYQQQNPSAPGYEAPVPSIVVFSTVRSPAEHFQARQQSLRSGSIVLNDTSVQDEIGELKRLRLHHVAELVSKAFGGVQVAESDDGELFPIGDVLRVSFTLYNRLKMDNEAIIKIVKQRHQRGDLGLNGSLVTGIDISEDMAFIPPLFGPLIESVAAVSLAPQNGLVRSIYQHDAETVAVWTLLSPGRPTQTFVFSPSRDGNS
jgi:hypothetical protein